jgi:hypothetical protein
MPRRTLLLGVSWLLLLFCDCKFSGCGKPEAGGACASTQSACADEHLGLFCSAGHLVTMTCRGPLGCQKLGPDDVACDNPIAEVGDGCNHESDTACTGDRASALVCKGDKFAIAEPCKGPRGCTRVGEAVHCDNALSDPGDLCTEEGDPACEIDRLSFMKCEKGKFRITNGCRGPKKCTVIEKPDENKQHFECDDSFTVAGDPCEDEGEESCSLDKRSFDVCKMQRIVASRACPGPNGCAYNTKTSHFECDTKKR